ncbi:MAG: AMP-binding protein [Candidatus Sumerlaeaceae bacterium]|nr:AMP-binding protein [Candidatus Sumerlaeaceae bacterium]
MTRTIAQLFKDCVLKYASVTAYIDDHSDTPSRQTYAELGEEVAAFAAGLQSAGIQFGDRVAVVSDNCPRWRTTDMALLSFGGVNVPRGCDSATPELWYIINHSESIAAVVQDKKTFERVFKVVQEAASLRLIVMLDDSAGSLETLYGTRVENYSALVAAGREAMARGEYQDAAVEESTLAAIVYTSGTTNIPKGVMLTHGNLCHQPEHIEFGRRPEPGELMLSILPTWHVYERIVEYFALYYGLTLIYSEKRHLREDLSRYKPHILPCVPRMWETIYDAIFQKLRKEPPLRQKLFHFFEACGGHFIAARRRIRGREARPSPVGPIPLLLAWIVYLGLWPLYRLGDKLVFSKIRNVTGGDLWAAVSGGGSLAPYLDDFFEVVGIPILNGYGLTETSPVLSVRDLRDNVRGTVGKPIPQTEIRIRDESGNNVRQGDHGVIWARGPQVMAGYFKNEEETRRILDREGWLNTGDLGWFTYRGHLVISGRAKDTIVLSGGENIEPEPIEIVASKSPLITQIMVVGQDQKALGALVFPDYKMLGPIVGLPEDTPPAAFTGNPKVIRKLREEIAHQMKLAGGFRSFEAISRVALLDEPFSEANGMLTQTMKLKRNVAMKRYATLIADLYK